MVSGWFVCKSFVKLSENAQWYPAGLFANLWLGFDSKCSMVSGRLVCKSFVKLEPMKLMKLMELMKLMKFMKPVQPKKHLVRARRGATGANHMLSGENPRVCRQC